MKGGAYSGTSSPGSGGYGSGSASLGEPRSASGTLLSSSGGSSSTLAMSPEDRKREQDLEGTFYEGVESAADDFMDSVEAMVGGKGKVPKLNLERIKAKEAADARRREEQRILREREERFLAQEQEAKRLAYELAEERRLSAQKIEEETSRRLKILAEQGNLDLSIDHERLQGDEFETQIKTDMAGRLSLQINLKRSSEHPYPGSPRALAEAEQEAERRRVAAEIEAQKEEARRIKEEMAAREEAVRKAEKETLRRAELEMAERNLWEAGLTPEELAEYRRRIAAGENPDDVMKSMKKAARAAAKLQQEQAHEAELRKKAEDDVKMRMAQEVAAKKEAEQASKRAAWEATLTPEQLAEYRRRIAAGENPDDVMKSMQWQATLTPEQLAEYKRRIAAGENPKDVMKAMQLSAFEASLSPEELAEYRRRIAAGEDPYDVMNDIIAIKKKNPFQFLDKDMQGFIKENIRGVLGHLENITEVIVHKQQELGKHKEGVTSTAGAAMDVLKASEKDGDKKKKKKEVHIQEESSSRPGTPKREKRGESSSRGSRDK